MIGDRLEAFHRESDGNYGRPRLHADLREYGIAISGKCVARSMRERNIQGATRRRFTVTTVRDRTARLAPDLVDRRFQADAPDQLWVADITYVPTWSGFYIWPSCSTCTAVASSVGRWQTICGRSSFLTRSIWRSSGGIQRMSSITPTRARSTRRSRLDRDAARPEFWNATLECELLVKRRFKNQREASIAIFDFIEGSYNPRRRHSALGYLSPNNFERRMSQAA